MEYLKSISDNTVFVCCRDGRLKDAFKKDSNIIVVKNYDEFIQKSITAYIDDYFIEKLQTELQSDITKESIVDYWLILMKIMCC